MGKDVAEALGYANQNRDIIRHVPEEDRIMLDNNKLNTKTVSSLGQRGGWVINESGLYSLILGSKLEKAKTFKHWVTSEVLPTIRKTGGYIKSCFFLLQYHSPLPPLSHFSVKKNFLIKPSESSEHQKIHYSWLEMSQSGLNIPMFQ